MKRRFGLFLASLALLVTLASGNSEEAKSLAETRVSIAAQANSIRSAVRAIRSDKSLANVIFIYEGNESNSVVINEARPIEGGGVYFTAREIPAEPKPTLALSEEAVPLGDVLDRVAKIYDVNIRYSEKEGAIIIQDVSLRREDEGPSKYPLDMEVEQADAARDMNYLGVLRVLDEKYGMNLPSIFDFRSADVEFMCPCNDLPAWKATDEPVQVRDLLISVLKTANGYLREHNDEDGSAYQIKTFRGGDGVLEYTIISF